MKRDMTCIAVANLTEDFNNAEVKDVIDLLQNLNNSYKDDYKKIVIQYERDLGEVYAYGFRMETPEEYMERLELSKAQHENLVSAYSERVDDSKQKLGEINELISKATDQPETKH